MISVAHPITHNTRGLQTKVAETLLVQSINLELCLVSGWYLKHDVDSPARS